MKTSDNRAPPIERLPTRLNLVRAGNGGWIVAADTGEGQYMSPTAPIAAFSDTAAMLAGLEAMLCSPDLVHGGKPEKVFHLAASELAAIAASRRGHAFMPDPPCQQE